MSPQHKAEISPHQSNKPIQYHNAMQRELQNGVRETGELRRNKTQGKVVAVVRWGNRVGSGKSE